MVERDRRVHPTWRRIHELRQKLKDQIVSSDTTDQELVHTMKEAIKALDQGIAYELDLFAWEDSDEEHFKNIDDFEQLKKRLEDNLRRKLERMANPPPPSTPLTPTQKANLSRRAQRWVAAGKPTPPKMKVKRISLSP